MNTFSQPLATESFSYSWLPTEPSSSETQHINNVIPYEEATQTFDFDFSAKDPNGSLLVHADKLFDNGVIKPQYLDDDDSSENENYASISSRHITTCSKLVVTSRRHSPEDFQKIFPRKRSMFPRKFLCKYLECLIPVKGTRGRIRVDDVNRRTLEINKHYNSNSYEAASPRINRSDSDESSIHEAILYCRRSSGSFS